MSDTIKQNNKQLIETVKELRLALEPFINTNETFRKPYNDPLSVYDRATDLLKEIGHT